MKTDLAPQNRAIDLCAFLTLLRLIVKDGCFGDEAIFSRGLRLLVVGVSLVDRTIFLLRAQSEADFLHVEFELIAGVARHLR